MDRHIASAPDIALYLFSDAIYRQEGLPDHVPELCEVEVRHFSAACEFTMIDPMGRLLTAQYSKDSDAIILVDRLGKIGHVLAVAMFQTGEFHIQAYQLFGIADPREAIKDARQPEPDHALHHYG